MTASVCEACGADFGCGAGTGSCWCRDHDVPLDVLRTLRERFDACLCPRCLAAAAGGDVPTRARPARSAAPPAASRPFAG